MKKKIFLAILLSIIVTTGCTKETNKEKTKIVEDNGMLSYTIDGEKTDIKPTKEEGYIVNKIICDNESDMMWDNDNWEIELTKINSKDRCKVDFTKDTSKEGYRITVTSNSISSLDSLSKATTLNGTIKIYSKSKIKNVTGCNGVIENNKVIISNVTSNQTCNITVTLTLADTIKSAYTSSGARSSFSSVYTTTALHTATDYDNNGNFNGTTYYFTGDPNNWVEFAGKRWRIIRINGNGSVRLLYAGSGGTDGYLTDVGQTAYNTSHNHPAYVGWKYTVGGNQEADRENSIKSPIYIKVESWYNGLSTTDKNYIDTSAIYCNNRDDNGLYNSSDNFYYATYTRFVSTKGIPTLSCNESDRFTTFGLMTADEVVLAGGIYGTSGSKAYYYLNASGESLTGRYYWWTMTPSGYYYSSAPRASVFIIRGSDIHGQLETVNVGHVGGVIRPVISLKSEVIVTEGNGSGTNPYTLQMP